MENLVWKILWKCLNADCGMDDSCNTDDDDDDNNNNNNNNAYECASVVRTRRGVWYLKYCSPYRFDGCVNISTAGKEISAD